MPSVRCSSALPRASGFTLIEVMVAVVLVSILAALALPSYRTYSIQGKLPEAQSVLAAQRILLEQYYADNQTFVGACTTGSSTALPAASRNFSYACSGLAAGTYIVTATGLNAMSGFVFTIDQNNTKATTGAPTGWTTSSSCWITKPAGC